MIVQPKVRGFICTTAHPVGCAMNVEQQISYVKSQPALKDGPRHVVVIGSSTGYGLASRIVAAFGGSKASTIGVFFEKEAEGKRTATAGYYNVVAFEQKALAEKIYAKSFNGDAYSNEVKEQVVKAIKKDWGKVDLLIYSLAAPRRLHPQTGELAKSVLKPINGDYTNKSIDLSSNKLEEVSLGRATQEEIDQTVSVMGGEDWEMWIEALKKQGLVQQNFMTVAYSYVGPEITKGIYRNGTIGRAKDHLEATARKLNEQLKSIHGKALISVNKALVTQSSSAIPFIPLYYILLSKVMKSKKIDENCIQQIYRLFATHLYSAGSDKVDQNGFVRLDDFELRKDVQEEVVGNWNKLNQDNLHQLADLNGYHQEFLNLFGFGFAGVDYNADVDIAVQVPSISNLT